MMIEKFAIDLGQGFIDMLHDPLFIGSLLIGFLIVLFLFLIICICLGFYERKHGK
jgi:hypothetical protein